jgi:hypothetical protein
MKKGLKKSAPDTPDPMATVEKRMETGKIHHNSKNVATASGLSQLFE